MWYVPKKRRAKLEPRWRNGVFLGRAWNSDQNYVGLLDGTVVRARALVRVLPSLRWDAERITKVSGTPLSMNVLNFDGIESHHDPHRGPPGHRHDGPDADTDQTTRRVQILLRDLLGYLPTLA